MLSMTGGLDRQVGMFRVGVLYTHAFGQSEADAHAYAQEFVAADPVQGSSWRVVAPYVGWMPHRRFRLWVSPGWVTGGGAVASGEGLDARMRMVVTGASLSLYSSREVSADIEADVFEVDVDRTPSVSERRSEMPEDAFSGRAQRARLAGRLGFPLGDPATSASRLTVRLGRRWDVGTDIDWVWGPIARSASWEGAGQVSATDLLVDLRYRRLRSSLSLVLTLGVQLRGEEPQVAGEHVMFSSRRQIGFGGGGAVGRRRVRQGMVGVAGPVVRARVGRDARLVERGGAAPRQVGRVRRCADARCRAWLRVRGRRPGVGFQPPRVWRRALGHRRPRRGVAVRPRVVTACGRLWCIQLAAWPMRTASKVPRCGSFAERGFAVPRLADTRRRVGPQQHLVDALRGVMSP